MTKRFPNVAFEYVEGDSANTMPAWIKENPSACGTYDVVHVDGGHFESCIMNDMKNTDILIRVGGIVIVDDTNSDIINRYVDMYLGSGKYKELDTLKTYGYPHRIIQKIM
jgi:3D (Asp-Asp-Asp) domain-containing protein